MPPATRAASFTRNVLGDRLADMSRGLRAARSPAEHAGLPRLPPAAQPRAEPGELAGVVPVGDAWMLGADPYGRLVARHAPTGATYLLAEPPAPDPLEPDEPGPDGPGRPRTAPDRPGQFPMSIEQIWPYGPGQEA
ncbi:MAG: hypothetical protein J2P26_06100 [Nocardiopsaceae bacterium]|nr:hypothetical protein [Nocardiopsaceae bacterium]